tara:strand:- start:1430 stop:1885 length:456 start_codon:yes stop_codon:yes gene_type:complete
MTRFLLIVAGFALPLTLTGCGATDPYALRGHYAMPRYPVINGGYPATCSVEYSVRPDGTTDDLCARCASWAQGHVSEEAELRMLDALAETSLHAVERWRRNNPTGETVSGFREVFTFEPVPMERSQFPAVPPRDAPAICITQTQTETRSTN